jgi:hypothetical protein
MKSSYRVRLLLGERVLSTTARHNLSRQNFAIPDKEKYPIEDREHAANALSRVSGNGSPEEKKAVRSKVCSRYPDMPSCKEAVEALLGESGFKLQHPGAYGWVDLVDDEDESGNPIATVHPTEEKAQASRQRDRGPGAWQPHHLRVVPALTPSAPEFEYSDDPRDPRIGQYES